MTVSEQDRLAALEAKLAALEKAIDNAVMRLQWRDEHALADILDTLAESLRSEPKEDEPW